MKTVVAITIFLSSLSSLWASCEGELFNITAGRNMVTIGELVDQMAQECRLSVVVKDAHAEKRLESKLQGINLIDVSMNDILDFALSDYGFHYELSRNFLKISYLDTKTFKVDYLGTTRKGQGATDISLTGQSSGSDNKTSDGGESKTKIEFHDDYDFWGQLRQELEELIKRPEDDFKEASILLNKGAGLVTVSGSWAQVKRAESYLKQLTSRLQQQVLIDVQILTVTHSDSESVGINWKKFGASVGVENYDDPDQTQSYVGQQVDSESYFTKLNSYTVINWQVPIEAVVDFLKGYGDVSSVSNPKVMTLNNQPALISIGNINYYKEIDVVDGGENNDDKEEYEYKPQFAGTLLDITPSINEQKDIILKVNPSVSKITTKIEEGAPYDLDTKQLSSIIRIKSGEKVVLGGLIKRSDGTEINKVPILGDLPLLSYAFKNETTTKEVEEMVIVITPYIVEGEKSISLRELGYDKI